MIVNFKSPPCSWRPTIATSLIFVNRLNLAHNPEDKTAIEKAEFIKTLDPRVATVINEYADVFEKPEELPPVRPEDQQIKLKDPKATPPNRRATRLSLGELECLKSKVDELMKKGFIQFEI